MKFRISLIIPLLLMIFALAISFFIFVNEVHIAEASIRSEALKRAKLDITRLQNVLYNMTTEGAGNLRGARLNISVTAMDANVRCLILADENDAVLVANRYIWEGHHASQVCHYNSSIANNVRNESAPSVFYSQENDSLLNGYYPVVLQLESTRGLPIKRIGVLFVETSIASSLATAFNNAVSKSATFAGVMLAVSAAIALILHLLVSLRLARLTAAARSLSGGNLEASAALRGQDELAHLGHAFDEMVIRIKDDISRRKQAETDLRELNETLELRVDERTKLLQQAQRLGHIGNWNLEISTGKLDWSDEIYRIFGYQPGQIEPSYDEFFKSVHPDDVQRIKVSEQRAFSQDSRHSIDHRIVLPDGEVRWVHEEAVVSRDESGKPVNLSGTVQDITERKLNEEKLIRAKDDAECASRAKSEFLSRMSHELRTPMNAILGFAQVLDIELTDINHRNYAHEIAQAGDHLLLLIGELLDLGRIEAGRMLMTLNTVDAAPVAEQALKIVHQLHEQKHLRVSNLCQSPILIIADAARLRQVLVNLLSNAAKYNQQGGSITLSCEYKAGDHVRLLVTDTGIGIQPDNISRLFTPFERLGAENSDVDGTGIGLALSRQLIELMGGKIGVESIAGKGSTFWIELPAASHDIIKTDTTAAANQVNSNIKCKVLYIEDNAANLRLVEAMLKHYPDITLMSTRNGHYGLELAQQYMPDVILLDIQLPDINGFHVLKTLQDNKETRHIPVIAISADAMPIDIDRGMTAGFRTYLTKPVNITDLVQAVRASTTR